MEVQDMKTKAALTTAILLAVVLALAVACGGDGANGDGGDGAGEIVTRQGLGVAALAASGDRGAEAGEGDAAAVPGAPSTDTVTGLGGAGYAMPDIFPLPYAPAQQSQDGITVQGYGSASVTADSAILEFYFGGKEIPADGTGIRDSTEPGAAGGAEPESAPETLAQPITEADLQPVVDAIVAAGVAADDVEVIVSPYYGDPYYVGSATVRATVRNIGTVQAVVDAATQATAGLAELSLSGTNVSYTVSDCAALEQAAMEAAVADARQRATSFAGVLGVTLGSVAGASNYSSSLYGGSPCDSQFIGPYPLGGIAYAEGQTPDVQLFAAVTITYAIR
jgi:uncharacterized protein YggE